MYVGQQLADISDARLTLEAQLGVEHIAISTKREHSVEADEGKWDVKTLKNLKEHIASFGISIDVMALETDTVLRCLVSNRELADKKLETTKHNIRAAAEAGIPCLKYRFQPMGVLRTKPQLGRGNVLYPSFDFSQYVEERAIDRALFYGGQTRDDVSFRPISAEHAWEAITYFLDQVMPVAEQSQVKLAFHPQDPPLPLDGDLRVRHVLVSVDSLKRLLDLSPSPYHGLNFCQGTVAEMCLDPATEVLEAIRYFGSRQKIFMVHFRNIQGQYLNFREVYPDNGDVDMYQALKTYQEVGYSGMLCPDHVPVSQVDPEQERQFSYCIGYLRGLLQAMNAESSPA